MTTTEVEHVVPDLTIKGRSVDDIRGALGETDDPAVIEELLGMVHSSTWELQDHQRPPPGPWWTWCFQGGRGCIAAGTRIYNPLTGEHVPVEDRTEPDWVQTLYGLRLASRSWVKGTADLWRVRTATGDVVVTTDQHRFLTPTGWVPLGRMMTGAVVASVPSMSPEDARRSMGTPEGLLDGCSSCLHHDDPRPRWAASTDRGPLPSRDDVRRRSVVPSSQGGEPGRAPGHILPCPRCVLLGRTRCGGVEPSRGAGLSLPRSSASARLPRGTRASRRSRASMRLRPVVAAWPRDQRDAVAWLRHGACSDGVQLPLPRDDDGSSVATLRADRRVDRASLLLGIRQRSGPVEDSAWTRIVAIEHVGHAPYYDLTVPDGAHYVAEGFVHHNTGKSHAGTVWINEHMEGPPCDRRWPGGHKALLLGPTHGDIIASMVRGVSGIKAYNRDVEFVGRKDGSFVVWPNGAEAVCLGMHTENDAERLRAQSANVCTWVIDEAAIGRHLTAAVDNLTFGARGSLRPHGIAMTTPKPTPQFKAFLRKPGVVVTHASSLDNVFLPAVYRQIISQYEGTRLGRQEIGGELVDDYEGALWSREAIDLNRITVFPADFKERLAHFGIVRVGVGIDPSTWIPEIGAPDEAEEYVGGAGIETGLVVVGMDRRREVYVFDDLSARMAALKWARRAASAYHAWSAAWVVPETNAGGDMVLATIHLTDPSVTIYREPGSKKPGVRARVGKRARAEPVALLWDQGRGHMVGEFPALEAGLTGWDPTETWSPDRLDALVWAVTALEPWRRPRKAGGQGAVGQAARTAIGTPIPR